MGSAAGRLVRAVAPTRLVGVLSGRLTDLTGGRHGPWVVPVLAAALGLSGADMATVSATGTNLRTAFAVGNTQIGVLVSVSAIAGAVLVLPSGWAADRWRRTRLLSCAVAVWSLAMVAAALATGYGWLLVTRVVLGAATAITGPAIASLTGDYFPAARRARIWGWILFGEMIGSGVGYAASGEIASLLGWRFAFGWLALPSAALVVGLRLLPEPSRGTQQALRLGEGDRAADPGAERAWRQDDDGGLADRMVRAGGARPREDMVLTEDPAQWSVWRAVRYVLAVRTNVIIIVVSALGYFFFSGIRSFAVLYVTGHFGVGQAVASSLVLVVGLGALAGVVTGGRLADRLLAGGRSNARVLTPVVCLAALVPVMAPAIVAPTLAISLPLLTLAAALLGAVNPPLDAARLDIMPAALWGRAEGVRQALRLLAEAAAPTAFGLLSDHLAAAAGGGTGLTLTFLIGLAPMVAAVVIALRVLRTYPVDVATASRARPPHPQ